MTDIASPPVRWTGGKWTLAPWVISHFPLHTCYVETHCGGAAVLFRKSPSRMEVINDLNQEVTNFFDILRDRAGDLQRALTLTPYSRHELRRAHEASIDPLERARRFYIRSWQKFNAGAEGHEGSWRYEKANATCYPLQNWQRQCDDLLVFAQRLRDVYIECDDAISVINRFDSKSTLFYCDPPYVLQTRTEKKIYANEMGEDDHRSLSETLRSVKGMVLISGYDSPLYRELYSDWKLVTARAFATKRLERIECMWLNPAASKTQQRQLF